MAEAKAPTLQIQVDDGLQRVPIVNTFGDEIGVFFFRPTDVGIIRRYDALAGKLADIAKPLEALSITADGEAEDDRSAEVLAKAEEQLYEAVDELFGGNFAEAFFGKMNPFSPVGGRFYCEGVIEAVGAFIEKQFDAEVSKISRKVGKYTGKYKK